MHIIHVLGYDCLCLLDSGEGYYAQRMSDCNLPPLQLDLDFRPMSSNM